MPQALVALGACVGARAQNSGACKTRLGRPCTDWDGTVRRCDADVSPSDPAHSPSSFSPWEAPPAPSRWRYSTTVPEADIVAGAKGTATVVQDDLDNTYQKLD